MGEGEIMAGRFTGTINKLCKGLLHVHNKIFFVDTQQFYSKEQNRTITMFIVSERVWDDERQKWLKQQRLKTASQVDVVKYLADRMKRLNEENDT